MAVPILVSAASAVIPRRALRILFTSCRGSRLPSGHVKGKSLLANVTGRPQGGNDIFATVRHIRADLWPRNAQDRGDPTEVGPSTLAAGRKRPRPPATVRGSARVQELLIAYRAL